jgi:hypothetical protein
MPAEKQAAQPAGPIQMSASAPSYEVKVFADRVHPRDWRVEAFDDDGGCEIAIFSGRDAEGRARRFAAQQYGVASKDA